MIVDLQHFLQPGGVDAADKADASKNALGDGIKVREVQIGSIFECNSVYTAQAIFLQIATCNEASCALMLGVVRGCTVQNV